MSAAPRVLIVPGLNDSGPAHWQTWLQQQHRRARRVQQRDWQRPDLDRWAESIGETLAREAPGAWVAVAHSFGCLALARWLRLGGRGVQAALFVAPADPVKFGVTHRLPSEPLTIRSVLVASRSDPWMSYGAAEGWARAWGSQLIDLGDAGHINAESGHGRWPLAKQLIERQIQRLVSQRHLHSEANWNRPSDAAAELAPPDRVARAPAPAWRAALP
ncbi:MAG: alpha/beta hydrolase [Rhizobacter sp.]